MISKTDLFLGIEGGGTRTVAILTDSTGNILCRKVSGPANIRLLSKGELIARLSAFAEMRPVALAIGLAGARNEADRDKIRAAASAIWPGIPCLATNDLETVLAATEGRPGALARVVIVSGTGSCCFGKAPDGRTAKIGGWGHFLGDKGSGYEIGLRALKAVVYYADRDGVWPKLGARILAALLLNEPDQLIGWLQTAEKKEIAALAVVVFEGWKRGDKIASDILEGAAHSLAKDAVHCARRLVSSGPVDFTLAGSVLLKQPSFAALVRGQIATQWPKAVIHSLEKEGAWGAAQLAKSLCPKQARPLVPAKAISRLGKRQHPLLVPPFSHVSQSSTEMRNPRSLKLDTMPISKAIELMLSEEGKVPRAILQQSPAIQKTVKWVAQALKTGHRLFYAGAGTSGRLGVLDASECPPTFRSSPGQIQGIIAGGRNALWEAVEGAEDDAEAGQAAVECRGVSKGDVVVGIAASGRTPFVWGALAAAKDAGARTVLICFDPDLRVPKAFAPGIIIQPAIGPEVLTGSTRLKAGTGTKLILNIITTLAMVQIGKVVQNLMVDLNPSNIKLRDRAVRIVATLTGREPIEVRGVLESSGWVVKKALAELQPDTLKKRRQ